MMIYKKLLPLFLAFALVLGMAGCGANDVEESFPTETVAKDSTYSVSVSTQGGMAMADIQVYVYADDSLADLVSYSQTDESGTASFALPKNDRYAITLSGVPDGYAYEQISHFSGSAAEITLTSRLVEGESLSGAILGLGDVMYDFSVVTPGGETITLSQMLEEKKMVLLNFWFSTCGPCANEFPYMQEAYEQYQDSVGIIALDPLEDSQTVATYQTSMGLSFPMAACQSAWSQSFNISGYPTSVIIDRYGVICLIEVGGITSLRPFTAMFEHFTAEDYEQKLFGSLSQLVTAVKPTYTMPSSEELNAALGSAALDVAYRPETDEESAEYAWPFIVTEKNGEACLKASNQGIESSYAILYADIYLEAGQAVAFDYLSSTEKGCDILYVIVDGQDVYAISGWEEEEKWVSCYPWVALKDGFHEVALCYLKDGDANEGEDTVYLKNLRVVDSSRIDTPSYIPREAAVSSDGFEYEYVDIFLNAQDGYYHVGSENGPLLLADLMNYTQFSEEKTLWELCYNGVVTENGENIYATYVDYFSYASNSSISGVCTVNEGLAELLGIIDRSAGFDEADDREWLKACRYYQVYGTDMQLSDPIAGLAAYSAYEAKLGVGIETNYFYYDRPIMPRGLLARFVPEKSGVYRITSHSTSEQGVDAWIFGEDRKADSYTYEADQRMVEDNLNVSMLYYMEAGQSYYIDIAFWDIYEVGTIYYDIEYVAKEYDVFRLASPGFFTYDTNATGEAMYYLISGGIDVALGEDGIYYQDLGNGRMGSPLYADFTGITGVFSSPLMTVNSYDAQGNILYDEKGEPVMIPGIIDLGGFDFSKTENDLYVLGIMEKYNGDIDAANEYLKALWGEDYDAYAQEYRLEDVFAGRYHGRGQDYTEQILPYLDRIITTGPEEQRGCVVVTQELAELLQMLMDKYTFSGVDHSWTKLCYYYDHLGPA